MNANVELSLSLFTQSHKGGIYCRIAIHFKVFFCPTSVHPDILLLTVGWNCYPSVAAASSTSSTSHVIG